MARSALTPSKTISSRPDLSHNKGCKSHVFQTPISPASSSIDPTHSAMLCADDSDVSVAKNKKRTRYEYTSTSITPVTKSSSWSTQLDYSDPMAMSGGFEAVSPISLANTRYRLAGGLDTPGVAAANAQEAAESEYYDDSFRRDLGGAPRAEDEVDHGFSNFSRIPPSHDSTSSVPREGWSKAAFGVLGGVISKVFTFCTASAFKGFMAGGGEAYNSEARPMTPSSEKAWLKDQTYFRNLTPIPGQYPTGDDLMPDYVDQTTPSIQAQPPAKRRQIAPISELDRNWVLVDGADESPKRPHKQSTIARPQSRFSMPTAASSRRTTGAASRTGAITRRTLLAGTSTGASHASSPTLHAGYNASFAPTRSPDHTPRSPSRIPVAVSPSKAGFRSVGSVRMSTGSPVAAEAARFAERKRAEDREADEAIRKFNRKLKEMIREGKEALGSRVEVLEGDGFEDDEGYEGL